MTEFPKDYECEGQLSVWDMIPKEKKVIICDRCGNVIDGNPKVVHVVTNTQNPSMLLLNKSQLCSDCREKFVELVDHFVNYKERNNGADEQG